MEHTESALHFAVVDYLRGELRKGNETKHEQAPFPGLIFTHPVGEGRDDSERFWAARKGYRPGTPDLLFWEKIDGVPTSMAIELKAPDRGPSANQRQFKYDFEEKGCKYAICRSVKEVRDTLIGWGLVCKNMLCREPQLSAKQKLSMHTSPILEALKKQREERSKPNA